MNWTPEQKRAIESRGVNLIVSASAGSGKTSVMVERILSLVREGASLDRMLVSTFTKSSAADMREKMYNSLSAAADNGHIARQLEILPQADITNLHSWYQRVIKKYFYSLGIDPAFEILEENEAFIVLGGALDEVIERNLLYGDERFLRLYEYLRGYRGDKVLRGYIIAIYDFAMTRANPDEWLDCAADENEKLWEEIVFNDYVFRRTELIRRIDELRLLCEQAGFSRNLKAIGELKDYLELKSDSVTVLRGKVPEEFIELNEAYNEIKKEATELRKGFEAVKSSPKQCLSNFKAELIRLTKELKEKYDEEKSSRSLMDFNDLEHTCAKLVSDSEVKDEIINSYDYVFVDEYQDINPLQEMILDKLAARCEMFYVGDIKQSIYAFRGCEPSIFLKRYESYKRGEGGEAIELNVNFRSGSIITDYCNKVMKRLMSKDFGGTDYLSEAMLKSVKEGEGEVSAFVFPLQKQEKTDSVAYDIEKDELSCGSDTEADAAADYILDLAHNGANYGDIAVLVRGASLKLDSLIAALSERGIPYKNGGTVMFCERREIMPLIAFLKLLNNFRDEYSLIAVMKSVFGGFSDCELAEIALGDGKDFYSKTHNFSSSESAEKCRGFWDKIAYYYNYSQYHTVYETVNKLVYEHKYFKYIFADSDRDAPDVLNAFLEHLSTCKYAESVYEYLGYIKNSSPVYEISERSDAVKIMTVHKSKGLEFQHVIYFNCAQKFSDKDYNSPMILDETGVHLKNWDENERTITETLDHAAAKCKMIMRRKEEELRLLYVALTRAKSSLAIFGTSDENLIDGILPKKCYWNFTSALELLAFSVGGIRKNLDTVNKTVKEERKVLLLQKKENSLSEELKKRFAFNVPSFRREQKAYVTKLAEATEPLEHKKVYGGETSGAEQALLRGTTYHEFMEKLKFDEDFDSQWNAFPSSARAIADYDLIKCAFVQMSRLCQGKKYYKEVPFTYNASVNDVFAGDKDNTAFVSDEKGERVLIQGVVDLMIEDTDGFILIDYKTTRPENILKESYKIQLSLYSDAIEKILNKPVKEKYIYSFVLKKLIKA